MRKRMNRRTFLISGSAGVAGLTLDFSSIARAALGRTGPMLSIGYVWGSDALAKADRRAAGGGDLSSHLVSATELPGGDAALVARGARITVNGRNGSGTGRFRSMVLEARFRPEGSPDASASYFAWEDRDGRRSPPVSFFMEPHEELGLEFAILAEVAEPAGRRRAAVRGASPAAIPGPVPQSMPFSLSLGWGDSPMLRAGVYFVAIADAPVSWRSFEYVEKPDAPGRRLYEAGGLGSPAGFDYITISVDYETPKPDPSTGDS